MNVEKQYRRTNLLQEHDYYYNLQESFLLSHNMHMSRDWNRFL